MCARLTAAVILLHCGFQMLKRVSLDAGHSQLMSSVRLLQVYEVRLQTNSHDMLHLIGVKQDVRKLSAWHSIVKQVGRSRLQISTSAG